MTASIFNRQRLVDDGRRLHMAIVRWGAKHGVRAYRVLTETGTWFEFYDPKTRRISQEFPAKIKAAIEASAESLGAYADWSRECAARWPPLPRFCRPAGAATM